MSQLTLDLQPTPRVPGLVYVREYVTRAEEASLLEAIERASWRTEWKRRTQHYGLSYAPGPLANGARKPEVMSPVPEWLRDLAERVRRDGWLARFPENAVINEYLPGQGIGAHRDYPTFGPVVTIVSLGAPYVMELARDEERVEIDLAARSLLVLGGDARTAWTHGIAARRRDRVAGSHRERGRRVSVTFRLAR